MGLEDFERALAGSSEQEPRTKSHRHHEHDGDQKHHRRHHRSHRHRGDASRDGERRHREKANRECKDEARGVNGEEDEQRHSKRRRADSPKLRSKRMREVKVFDIGDGDGDEDDDWVEKEISTAPPGEHGLDQRDQEVMVEKVQRDAWMKEPAALDIDYMASRKAKPPPSQFVTAKHNHEMQVPEAEVGQALADLEKDFDSDGDDTDAAAQGVKEEPAQHDVSYTFGDSGSSWRMTKLKAVYRQAAESGRPVDDVAVERYGELRDFDDAREEEREMDRRRTYGKEYVGVEKPSGELFQERKLQEGMNRDAGQAEEPAQGEQVKEAVPPTAPLDQTALNKLKAQLMKAKLRNASNAAQLEAEYNLVAAASLANPAKSETVVLDAMDNRQLAGGRSGEVNAVTGKRGRERGLVTENEDMSIDDMVRHEKRTRGADGGEGRAFAERIAKDGKFENDLDYMDDNASKLSKKVVKSDVNLRNTAISDFQRMQKVLETCPLCHHEESNQPPTAPVVSLATRTYLTLATEPEIAKGGAVIVPIQHRANLLECDEDEWEELRNFMKSLTRHYAAQDKGVIFYENAAHTLSHPRHAALVAVPLPHHLADTASAYFTEAVLAADEQWSQHKPIIDTLALAQRNGYGKKAFQRSMAKEMPYFHVWFTLDGGMGHVVEDERRWPKGDFFAREVLGGMLDRGPEVIKRQGRWEKGDRRVESFRKKWEQWDWTKVLMEAQ